MEGMQWRISLQVLSKSACSMRPWTNSNPSARRRVNSISTICITIILQLSGFLLPWDCMGSVKAQFVVQNPESSVLKLGSSLQPNESSSWVSTNGMFALGFHALGENAYTVSIWYANISLQTVVWIANRNSPVTSGASLQLRSDGNLILLDFLSQDQPVWESDTRSKNVTSGEILDSGNLVLKNSRMEVVWESFHYPSDTLLPEQHLLSGSQLLSWQTSSNPGTGRYSLEMEIEGNLRLYNFLSPAYYWSAPGNTTNFENSSAFLSSSGIFGVYNGPGSDVVSWRSSDAGTPALRRLTLAVNGALRIHSWTPISQTWTVVWRAMNDECMVTDLCGAYGICSYEPDLMCSCPLGFSIVDPTDWSQGCEPPMLLDCNGGPAGQQFLNLDNTEYVGNDYRGIAGAVSESECVQRCAEDCLCAGALYVYDGNGTCSLKSQLHTGHINSSTKSFVKLNGLVNLSSLQLQAPSPTPIDHGSQRLVAPKTVAIIVLTFVMALVILLACCCYWWREAKLHEDWGGRHFLDYIPGAPTRFSYKELQAATGYFSQRLGSGGFGTVYKGILPDETCVAVKQLEKTQQGEKEFRAEVATIGSTHHMNLVRLYGFCSEGPHRLLVYEYMANGSLDKFVFEDESNQVKNQVLDWYTRFRILLGTARALAYLHNECRDCIIHCDIKPENILLDRKFVAKVSDFGLAKFMTKNQTRVLTSVRGTHGYLAPEWMANSAITSKSDVYSFGLVLLEVIAGRRNIDITVSCSAKLFFPKWGFQQAITRGKYTDVVDSHLAGCFDARQVETALQIPNSLYFRDGHAIFPRIAVEIGTLKKTSSDPKGCVLVHTGRASTAAVHGHCGAHAGGPHSHRRTPYAQTFDELTDPVVDIVKQADVTDGGTRETFDLNSPLMTVQE